MARTLPAETWWSTLNTALGRLACAFADPAGVNDPHDHAICIHDDASYAADLLLRLAAAITIGDDDAILDHLTAITDTVKRDPR